MKVKICGLTSTADAFAAVEAGADWLGLNFHPRSPRFVDERLAAEIADALPPHIEAVGLFVNRPPKEVAEIAEQAGLRTVQLHGDEPVADLVELDRFQIVRAFRLGTLDDVLRMRRYVAEAANSGHPLFAVLVDASVPGQFGGTGHTVQDEVLDRLIEIRDELPRLILAGGLTTENVAERVKRVDPWMVDTASGVESAPGRKDAGLVREFVRRAKGIDG